MENEQPFFFDKMENDKFALPCENPSKVLF